MSWTIFQADLDYFLRPASITMMSARGHYRQRRMTHDGARDGDRGVNDVHFSRVDYVFYSATLRSGLLIGGFGQSSTRSSRHPDC
jgi:hypothetical protein